MNARPMEHDLEFLVGSLLLQVCIGENEVILRFDKEISVTIESRLMIRDSSGLVISFNTLRSAAGSLVELLSDTVIKTLLQRTGTLRLWFSRGDVLDIYASNEGYESYQIQHGEEVFVV